MVRADKAEAVRDIAGRFRDSPTALLTEYRGLTVADIAEVRGALRRVGADYKVLKNTLTRIAAQDVGLSGLEGALQGPTAIAFVRGDAVEAARALDEATRRFPVLAIKGGVLEGKVIDADQARELARLEPREGQLARIAALLNAPLQQTATALGALLRDLGSMLAQVLAAKESGGSPGTEPATPAGDEAAAGAGEKEE